MADLEFENREQIADWVETTLLARKRPIGRSTLARCAEHDGAISEDALAGGVQVMRHRSRTLGDDYPFEVSKIFVGPRDNAFTSLYSTLLLLSPGSPYRQLIDPMPTTDMAVLFEQITVEATKQLLGSNSDALRFGWPSDEGRPERFGDAIEWLANRMGVESGTAFRSPRRKDGGVDVVAWRPFPDGRTGFPVTLVQCTLQRDIVPKSRDIDLRIWAGWLTLEVDPLVILAVPGTVRSGEEWDEIAVRSLILDRIRITGLVSQLDTSSFVLAEQFAERGIGELSEHLSGTELA